MTAKSKYPRYANFVSIIGESESSPKNAAFAKEVGYMLAKAGIVVVCGAGGGVMEAACKGAKRGGGVTVGILPGSRAEEANAYVDIPVVTGVGYARNKYVVKSGRVVIAIGGSYGTLSEIGFALGYDIPVIGLNTWEIKRQGTWDNKIILAKTAKEAVAKALAIIKSGKVK
jgi:uncharacterized protein (TIGR00725 family)